MASCLQWVSGTNYIARPGQNPDASGHCAYGGYATVSMVVAMTDQEYELLLKNDNPFVMMTESELTSLFVAAAALLATAFVFRVLKRAMQL